MKKIVLIPILTALIFAMIGGSVLAEPAGNMVEVDFQISYGTPVYGDSFTNTEVWGFRNWSSGLGNPGDSGEPIIGPKLTLTNAPEFIDVHPPPDIPGPPTYEWFFDDIPEDVEGARIGVNLGDSKDYAYTPGFDVMRSVNVDQFGPSGGTQTLFITITPDNPPGEEISFGTDAYEDEYLVTRITGVPFTSAGVDIYHPGDHRVRFFVHEPYSEPSYTCEVTIDIEVKPGVALVEYMPNVIANSNEVQLSGIEENALFVTYDIPHSDDPPLTTWTWSATANCDWHWTAYLMKGISLRGYTKPQKVHVDFQTNYNYHVPEDSFTNDLVTGGVEWNAQMGNWLYITEEDIDNTILSFTTDRSFEHFQEDNIITEGPPIYEWSYGNLSLEEWAGSFVGLLASEYPVEYHPGFDATRTVDNTEFAGPDIQELIITVIPRTSMNGFVVDISAMEDELVNPIITSFSGGEQFELSHDGHHLNIWQGEPEVDPIDPYVFHVYIEVIPKIPHIEFMPSVQVRHITTPVDMGTPTTTPISYEVNENGDLIGEWTWNAIGSYPFYVYETINYGIYWEARSEASIANVIFDNAYNYNEPGDSFTNSLVEGNKDWHAQLDTSQMMHPLTNVNLRLESGLDFEWIDPEPTNPGPPIEWSFGDVDPHSYLGIGVSGDYPINFFPGISASRSVVPERFLAPDTVTQVIDLTVIPERPTPYLNINVNGHDGEEITAVIIAPETDEEQGIWLNPDGFGLHINIPHPEVGTPLNFPITLEVTPHVPGVEILYKPDINISCYTNLASGTTTGNFLSLGVPDLGTWIWNTADDYIWQWHQKLRRNFHFEGASNPLVNNVTALFNTFWTYLSPDDDFISNGDVPGWRSWSAQILNGADVTGEPVTDVELTFDSALTFNQAFPPPDDTDPLTWWFSGQEVGEDETLRAAVRNAPDPDPIPFNPGFDAFRSVDEKFFSGPRTQNLAITLTSGESGQILIAEVFAMDNERMSSSIVSWGEADFAMVRPDRRYLMIGKQFEEAGIDHTFNISLEVAPNIPQVEYKPTVRVYSLVPGAFEEISGNVVSYTVTDIGTWTWITADDYQWVSLAATARAVAFPGRSLAWIEDYSIEHMSVDFSEKVNEDRIAISKATIGLGEEANYDLEVDEVTIDIDGVVITIPPESFTKKGSKERYEFKSAGNDQPKVDMAFDFDKGEWSVKISDIDADVIDNGDGVDVTLTIGPMVATENIQMFVGGLTYIAG